MRGRCSTWKGRISLCGPIDDRQSPLPPSPGYDHGGSYRDAYFAVLQCEVARDLHRTLDDYAPPDRWRPGSNDERSIDQNRTPVLKACSNHQIVARDYSPIATQVRRDVRWLALEHYQQWATVVIGTGKIKVHLGHLAPEVPASDLATLLLAVVVAGNGAGVRERGDRTILGVFLQAALLHVGQRSLIKLPIVLEPLLEYNIFYQPRVRDRRILIICESYKLVLV